MQHLARACARLRGAGGKEWEAERVERGPCGGRERARACRRARPLPVTHTHAPHTRSPALPHPATPHPIAPAVPDPPLVLQVYTSAQAQKNNIEKAMQRLLFERSVGSGQVRMGRARMGGGGGLGSGRVRAPALQAQRGQRPGVCARARGVWLAAGVVCFPPPPPRPPARPHPPARPFSPSEHTHPRTHPHHPPNTPPGRAGLPAGRDVPPAHPRAAGCLLRAAGLAAPPHRCVSLCVCSGVGVVFVGVTGRGGAEARSRPPSPPPRSPSHTHARALAATAATP